MKTAKKSIAILLCIAMILGFAATNSFAYKIGDTVEWKYTEDDIGANWIYEYPYGGTLNMGSNDVEDLGEPYSVVYEFNAENTGYYKVTYDSVSIYRVDFENTFENGIPVNHADRITHYGENEDRLFYLAEGAHMLCVNYNEDYPAGTELIIEYVAESIADITYNTDILETLILEYDVYSDSDWFSFSTEYTLTFSNGKTIEYKNDYYNTCDITVIAEKNWAKGENTAKLAIPGYEKEITVTVHEISEYVKDIELSNIDKYLDAYEYYNYTYGHYRFGETPEKVTVTYTDGTKKTFDYYYGDGEYNTNITLQNGKEVHVYIYQTGESENRTLVAGIAEKEFIIKKCNVIKADFISNFDYMQKNIRDWVRYGAEDIKWHFESMLTAYDFEDFTYHLKNLFTSVYISVIFDTITEFIEYYL